MDRTVSSTLYALTGSGVFKSTDGGGTWNAKTAGLPQGDIFVTMTLYPTDSSILYAVDGYGTIFKTWDRGENWNTIHPGSSDGYLIHGFSLAIDPATPSSIYSYRGSFFEDGWAISKSTDGGVSWNTIENRVPRYIFVISLAIDPMTPSTIYASYESYTKYARGILKSVDAGASWNALNEVPSAGFSDGALAIDPSAPTTIYAGFFDSGSQTGSLLKSPDGGENWNAAGAGLATVDVHLLTPDPVNGNIVYTGGNGGLFRSVDAGATWAPVGAFQQMAIRSLLIDPADTQVLYAELANPDGSCSFDLSPFLKSKDGGASWNGNVSPADSVCILGSLAGYPPPVVMSPSDPATLYIAETDDLDGIYELLKSVDGGVTWGPWQNNLQSGVAAAVIDPTTPTTVYAGTNFSPAGGVTLLKSTDGATTWNSIGLWDAATTVLAIDPTNPSVLYAGVEGDYANPRRFGGLFKSTDAGATWSTIINGLDHLWDTNTRVTALVLDPAEFPSPLRRDGGRGCVHERRWRGELESIKRWLGQPGHSSPRGFPQQRGLRGYRHWGVHAAASTE